MSTSDAIQAIERYLRVCGCDHAQWCTGIAVDPVERLLREHGVAEEGDGCGWITYHCASHGLARQARDHFVARGMKAAAGEDGAATSVYAFRITPTTRC
jgi:hypothetical protein